MIVRLRILLGLHVAFFFITGKKISSFQSKFHISFNIKDEGYIKKYKEQKEVIS